MIILPREPNGDRSNTLTKSTWLKMRPIKESTIDESLPVIGLLLCSAFTSHR